MAKLKRKLTDQELISLAKTTYNTWEDGELTLGGLNYSFQPRKFQDVVYLYAHSVNTKTPDLLDVNNRNTQRNPLQAIERKWREQTSVDLKDINFTIDGASPLARFIPKAANRKVMDDSDMAETVDDINDLAIRYGSSFLKTWVEKKELKMKDLGPYDLAYDIEDFTKGPKLETFSRTIREVCEDENYDVAARTNISTKTVTDDLDKKIVLRQMVRDFPDGTQNISILTYDGEYSEVLYQYTTKPGEEKVVEYFKNDFSKREGFADAPAQGLYELVFSELVQSKVSYERMDRVMELATQIVYQKKIDGRTERVAGKDVTKIKPGKIIGYKENPVETVNMGGANQVTMLRNEINEIFNGIGPSLNMSDALLGDTLPSGTSGVLGNLLSENSSSVLKEYQKNYANFLDRVYQNRVIPYIMGRINSDDDLKKYLTPNDYKLVKMSVRNYLMIQKQIDAVLNDVPFDPIQAEREVDSQLKKSKIIPGELLEQLREEMVGIRTYISGENVSKAQVVSFIQKIQADYMANPQILRDPFYRETVLKLAEYDAGMSVLEIEALLDTLPDQMQAQLTDNVQTENV